MVARFLHNISILEAPAHSILIAGSMTNYIATFSNWRRKR